MDNNANKIEADKLQDAFETQPKSSLYHNNVSSRIKMKKEMEGLQNEVISLVLLPSLAASVFT